ncbi:eukaryotic translation initiation factor 4B-like isoform X1 [Daphnia pulicaria]|uniref:eukaryotic translation initiation factor 4B-like isoform X1 n=1 Tax=Daphnia pulicaria TaxID=35523 RepID=UPI001EEB7547|nr:eukaryotic translation initiation factor 4B-like isoform X1 [Daphnia pulicaria]
MAASAKKGKKSKGKVLSLNEFLSDDHGGSRSGEAVVMAPSKTSWADEMEDEAIYKEKLLLPTAPRAARGSDIDESRIPNNAPYTAYIANLPYDIEVEDVSKFFHGLSVKSVRLPREGGDGGRLRGFGYAEFETRQDLVDALTMNELMIKNRKIRVDIASGADGDQEQGAGGMGRGRGRPARNDEEREDRTPSDWRNAPREGPPPGQDRGGGGGFRGGDRGGDRMEREPAGERYSASFNPRDRPPGSALSSERSSFGPRRDGPSSSFGGGRDGPPSSGFGGRDRDGPSSFGGRDREGSSSFGGRDREGGSSFGGRDRDGPSSFSRGRDGPSSFGRDREGGSSFGRDRDGPSSFGRERDGPSSFNRDEMQRSERPSAAGEPTKERPKLSLKPRSVPIEEGSVADEPAAAAAAPIIERPAAAAAATAPAAPPSSASIFGAARPVDTAARERAIEERLKEKQMKEREPPLRGRETDRQDDRNQRDNSHGSGGRSSERPSGGRGRSSEGEKTDDRRDYRNDDQDNRRPARDGPGYSGDSRQAPKDGDYRPPQRSTANPNEYRPPVGGRGSSGGGNEYRPPRPSGGADRRDGDRRDGDRRDGDRDYRGPAPARDGDYRPPRGDESRKENGLSRGGGGGGGAGIYRAPSRGTGPSNERTRSRDDHNGDRRPAAPASSASSADEATRVRRLEEPKAPVFENSNKFAFLLAEDEGADESDSRDEQ